MCLIVVYSSSAYIDISLLWPLPDVERLKERNRVCGLESV
jgi:hypothetical protein